MSEIPTGVGVTVFLREGDQATMVPSTAEDSSLEWVDLVFGNLSITIFPFDCASEGSATRLIEGMGAQK